ncbi:ComEC family competence protein [mine drainage metagenome]|uniref:ComEC family competence protein n=1 Tax=mine drainage metagenome TaxID=410659 RepID=A0A1J5RFZ2_9ZZZZ
MGILFLNERDRWIFWLPVALGTGIALYFSLPSEPPLWVGGAGAALFALLAWGGRRFLPLWIAAVYLSLVFTGFFMATERTVAVAAPRLEHATWVLPLQGRLLAVDPAADGLRLLLDRLEDPKGGMGERPPRRVRLHLAHGGQNLRAGQIIAFQASLMPPPPPVAPGGYDFARVAWFEGLGAVGYITTPPEIVGRARPDGWSGRLRLMLRGWRDALTAHIGAAMAGRGLPDGTGATAAALITGERGAVPPVLMQAYRDAGLAHILVIAGMHMSMVAGLVYGAMRGALAAFPALALRFPIKKWAAAAALAVTFGYLLVSGAPVPTQRAFVMNGFVLLAVLLDREALSLRTITWAATAVLLLEPEALTGASFQLSFAAVYMLISGYEILAPRLAGLRGRGGWAAMLLLHGAGILLTTLLAAAGTAFYALYHFNRFSAYALLGNLLAVPVVGLWVMPAALLAMLLLPLGLDGPAWGLMGHGLVLVDRIALLVAGLPGAVLSLPKPPLAALALFTLGGLWLLLWRRPWRVWGLAAMAAALGLAALSPPPDLLVDDSGRVVAARLDGPRLAFSRVAGGRMLQDSWRQQAGVGGGRAASWAEGDPVRCDGLGCVLRLKGWRVALPDRREALADDCRLASLIVAPFAARCPPGSAALVLDGPLLRRTGTHRLWLGKPGLRMDWVAQEEGRRPWTPFAFQEVTP